MKRLPILSLTLLLALTLSACHTVPPESADSSPGPTAEPTVEPTAAPTRGGQTLEELEESVEITLGENVKDRPEVLDDDLKEIIYASAHSWMRHAFEKDDLGQPAPKLLDFECVKLTLNDISEDGSVFIYGAAFDFLPEKEEDWGSWAAGNTGPRDGREGWYKFSRGIGIKRDGKSWEIVDAGTAVFMDSLMMKIEANKL